MRIKYNGKNAIRLIIILVAVSITLGFLHMTTLFALLVLEMVVIIMFFAKKLMNKITGLQLLWIVSTLYTILNTRTFTYYTIYYIINTLIGLMVLICVERDSCDLFYDSFRFFVFFGVFAGLTSVLEVFSPNTIISLFSALSPGKLPDIYSFLRNGRYLGITNYVWYTSLMLFVGGSYIFSDFSNSKRKRKAFYLFALLVLLIAVFLSGSRSGILLFPIIAGLSYGERNTVKSILLVSGLLCIAYLVVMYSNSSLRIVIALQNMFTKVISGDVIDARRASLRELAVSLFQTHKLFGIGWYEFRYYSNSVMDNYYHVHNLYYQLLCENGIIGTAIIACPWAITLVRTARFLFKQKNQKQERTYRIAKFCFMIQIYFYVASIVHVTLFDGPTVLLFYIICGISLTCIRQTPSIKYKARL